MKTVIYQTNHFVRREGNVIDLCEYRARMEREEQSRLQARARAVGEDTAGFQWQVDESVWHDEAPEEPQSGMETAQKPRRRHTLADLLEVCASGAALLLALTIWIQLLLW